MIMAQVFILQRIWADGLLCHLKFYQCDIPTGTGKGVRVCLFLHANGYCFGKVLRGGEDGRKLTWYVSTEGVKRTFLELRQC